MAAVSEQSCQLSTHDGLELAGRIINAKDAVWIVAGGKSEQWVLRYSHASDIEIFKNGKLFDSMNLYQSLRDDLSKMSEATHEMQMYLNKARWWQKNFTRTGTGSTLNRGLISSFSIAASPLDDSEKKNAYSFAFNPMTVKIAERISLRKEKYSVSSTAKFDFAKQFSSETLETQWWRKDSAPKRVVWGLNGKKNILRCEKPQSQTKVVLPNVEKVQGSPAAKRNFLQLVHVQGVLNVINQLNEKSKSKRKDVLAALLTGICSKHLLSVYRQIEESIRKKNASHLNDKSFMKLVGSEFGESVSAEFRPYQTVLGRSLDKQAIIASYQAHCSDPLGLLIESYNKPLNMAH
jgi:hypothetical protein